MTDFNTPTIHRRPDGSIDTAAYAETARLHRSEAFHRIALQGAEVTNTQADKQVSGGFKGLFGIRLRQA
ncbi:hypothetical protein [Sneathiella limimaris]|uniref:hypothetical protein n=1 Tax=Sneathiella limimaris TaxID=1964213 RepID=UPI00146CC121|nr:hypothetical protein [Sneathiella limimaris]